jgi:hypothetical protein
MIAMGNLVKADPKRNFLLVMNLSDTAVFIGSAETLTTGNGLRLNPHGGSVAYDERTHGRFPKNRWNVVSSADTKAVLVQEGRIV